MSPYIRLLFVSTHASVRRRLFVPVVRAYYSSFNSRLREEATINLRRDFKLPISFNSRLREEATKMQVFFPVQHTVSTHASVRRRH